MEKPLNKRVLVAVTGASGSIYAQRLITILLESVDRIYLVASETGKKVAEHELGSGSMLSRLLNKKFLDTEKSVIRLFSYDDFFAPIASGSSAPTHMVIVPCSMGAVARIACGISSNLIERAADVMLKEKKPLILCPRETPLNEIHLQNMLTLSKMGVLMIPAMPGFYHNPKTLEDLVDFLVGRLLDSLDVPHELYRGWNSRMR